MIFLRVKNWEEFQQYKDRDPKWIKMHRDLLYDYDLDQLDEVAQIHLVKIWLLAAKLGNKIPNDPTWVGRQIGAKSKVDLNQLRTKGFLIAYESVQDRTETYLEEEEETEKEREEEQDLGDESPDEFERLWAKRPRRAGNDPKHEARKAFNARRREGVSVAEMEDGLERYSRFVEATGKTDTEYVMRLSTFLGPSKNFEQSWSPPRRLSAVSNEGAIREALG